MDHWTWYRFKEVGWNDNHVSMRVISYLLKPKHRYLMHALVSCVCKGG